MLSENEYRIAEYMGEFNIQIKYTYTRKRYLFFGPLETTVTWEDIDTDGDRYHPHDNNSHRLHSFKSFSFANDHLNVLIRGVVYHKHIG